MGIGDSFFWEICRVGGKLGVIEEGWEGCGSGRVWVSFEMGVVIW